MYTVWHLGESGKSRHFSVDPIPRHSSFNPSLIFFSSFFYLAPFPPFRNHHLHQVILSRAPFVSKIQRATRISQLWKIRCFHRISPSFFFFFWSLTMVRCWETVWNLGISTQRPRIFQFIWEEFFKYWIAVSRILVIYVF